MDSLQRKKYNQRQRNQQLQQVSRLRVGRKTVNFKSRQAADTAPIYMGIKSKFRQTIMVVFSIAFLVAGGIGVMRWYQSRPQVLGEQEIATDIKIPLTYTEPLQVTRGGNSLTVQPVKGEKVKVEKMADQFIYREAYKNTDVIQTEFIYKIKEELVFKKPGHPTRFEYKLGNVEKYEVEEDSRGNIVFYDKALLNSQGKSELTKVFTIPTPFVEDANKNRSFIDLDVFIQGDQLIVEVDEDWLKTARYPVILDPTIEINVLNIKSYPVVGGEWQVDFTTQFGINILATGAILCRRLFIVGTLI